MAKARPDGFGAVAHQPTISSEMALKRLEKLLEQVPEVRSSGRGPAASTWVKNVKIVFAELYGEPSLIFKEFNRIPFHPGAIYSGQPRSDFVNAFNAGLDQATGFLESRVSDLRENVGQDVHSPRDSSFTPDPDSRRIFVVHGHDQGNKETVARFLGKLDLEPIILHEQPDQGNTLIEKFEAHAADVQGAVVILTADDIASSRENPEQKELRARQNVILELGFFVGKLGRKRTFALVEKGVTLPSDIHGVIYIPIDNGEWRLHLVKELKAAGLQIDANRAF
ncbi:MAG: TIR domain-containing protein [Ktedonobacteraceae bacterium]